VGLFRSILLNRRLLRDFVTRDLKARYVGSAMGFFWSIVFPVLNLFVFMFVFRLVLNARWSDHQGPLEVALVMLAGIVVWSAFAETMSRATNSLVENANLIKKVVFPSELLPLYLTISSLINMCIGIPVVVLCVAWFGFLAPPELAFDPSLANPRLTEIWEEGVPARARVALTRGFRRPTAFVVQSGGTATLGEDYTFEGGRIELPRGRLAYDLILAPIADGKPEGTETIVLGITATEGAPRGEFHTVTFHLSDGAPPPGRGLPDPGSGGLVGIDATYRYLNLGPSLALLPLLFVLQVLFTVGLGYFLAALNVFLRDVYHLVGVFTTVWMFGTPIFYPAVMVEKAGFGWMLRANPMHWLIDSYRAILLYGTFPDWTLLGRFALVALVVFAAGGAFFRTHKGRFPDLL